MADVPSRAAALELVHEYTESSSLRKHMYAVEAGMRAYAEKYGEDAELWGITGLIHDFDYERWPNDEHSATEEHPSAGVAILRERGWPDEVLDAVMAHADYTGVEATTVMARAPKALINEEIWPEFEELHKTLHSYLSDVTKRVIATAVHGDVSEPEVRKKPRELLPGTSLEFE